jgi:RNA polymerase sigma-70 factor (ECF subfamily)
VFSRAGLEPGDEVAQDELLSTLRTAMSAALTPHQRGVFVALELNSVPIDVVADRLHTTRGALYETLQDARRELRTHFASCGLPAG